MHNGTYAVIPVKPFASAKQRLSSILSGFERTQLARLMLEDVLDSVNAARSLDGFFVVTSHREAAKLAKAAGGQVIAETGESGLAHAVGMAVQAIAPVASGVVVVPADIPHLPSATIDAVVASTPERGITLLPATYDGGTNLLAMRPCDLLPPLFGPRSFQRHHDAALRAGLSPVVHMCLKAGHDLDRPEDLQTFLAAGSRTRTHDYLAGLHIGERLATIRAYAASLAAEPV